MPSGLLHAVREEAGVRGEIKCLVEIILHVGHAEPVLPLHLAGEIAADGINPAEKHLRLPGGGRRRRQREVAPAGAGADALASPAAGEQRDEEERGEENAHGS